MNICKQTKEGQLMLYNIKSKNEEHTIVRLIAKRCGYILLSSFIATQVWAGGDIGSGEMDDAATS
ncbi:MAG: hypothetical protein ABL927_12050, partial [Bdellovibrionales bacterium]